MSILAFDVESIYICIFRTEYELHERQLELLSSVFDKRDDESAKTAAEYLRKMKTKFSTP